MKQVTITLDSAAYLFYEKIAQQAGLPVEQVLADALFRFAGQLSIAMRDKKK